MKGGVLLLGTLVLCACGPEAPLVLLSINFDGAVEIPSQVNAVEVEVVASRTRPQEAEGWRLCQELRQQIFLDSPADLPVLVAIEQGEEYRAALAYRVVAGRHGADPSAPLALVHPGYVGWTTWPSAGGAKTVYVVLSDTCFGRTCGASEHCVQSRCDILHLPDLFLSSTAHIDDVSCER